MAATNGTGSVVTRGVSANYLQRGPSPSELAEAAGLQGLRGSKAAEGAIEGASEEARNRYEKAKEKVGGGRRR